MAEKSTSIVCFTPNDFAIVDLLPPRDSFTAQSFIAQISKPLSQEHCTKSADIPRRSLRLPFGNSRSHPAKIMPEEMARLKGKRVPHPPYSLDLAIADFDLFGVLKQKLPRIDVSDDGELKSEILTIFQSPPSDGLKQSFGQWIEN
jgi:hypothetical protein